MARGRKPKPTSVKKLEGNPGKRKLNEAEPVFKNEMPPCPEWLEREAKAEWNRIYPQLSQLGILTSAEYVVFALYCQCWARWAEAEDFITKFGAVYKNEKKIWKEVPQIAISARYGPQMLRAAAELGLTPSSRARLSTGQPTGYEKDPMEGMLD